MTRADSLLMVFAMILVGTSFYLAWQPSEPGSLAVIYRQNTLVEELDLSKTTTVRVAGKLGDSIIQVADGRVRFQDSPCQSKFCVHAGWLHQSGEVIACLPNGIHIEVEGSSGRFDALAF
ncbi:MAG: NusG domain II-containing protein [Thiohalophilus sp.]|jgi:hypothetical protein